MLAIQMSYDLYTITVANRGQASKCVRGQGSKCITWHLGVFECLVLNHTHLDGQESYGHALGPDEHEELEAFLPEQLSQYVVGVGLLEELVDEPENLLLDVTVSGSR